MLYIAVNMLTALGSTLYTMETMGQRIRVLREARSLSVDDVAQLLGVQRSAVYQWEAGSVTGIKPENFVRLYHVLRTTPEYLVWGADGPPADDPAITGKFKARPRL